MFKLASNVAKLSNVKCIATRHFSNVPDKLWNLGKLNHVAIAVPNMDKAVAFYKNALSATKVSDKVAQPEHGVYTVFVELGNTKIELLYPLGEKSPIKGFLDKNVNGGIHHICIEVDNIHEAMKTVKENKIRCLSEEPRI
ncbi:methylmalonyl- mitochondrial, partial [Brachionus plicatilis]